MAEERGCGERVAGGVYSVCPLGPHGSPVEHFLLDPPKVIDPEQTGFTPIGVQLRELNGSWHVFDWVGEKFYPNVADFVEEVRHMGMSRRLELNPTDYEKLGPGSRHFLIHSRAFIDQYEEYYEGNLDVLHCPSPVLDHTAEGCQDEMCAGLWWQDIKDGEHNEDSEDPRLVVREMPSFTYIGRRAPTFEEPVTYKPALFAGFPIHHLEVVRDEAGKSHVGSMARAIHTNLPVRLVDE